MRVITERVHFLTDEETAKAIERAVRALKDAGVKPAYDPSGPNRVSLGYLMRELIHRHLDATVAEILAETAKPKARKRKKD